MKLPPFLLDQWIAQKHDANSPIEFDLASSTGPGWTFRELLALGGDLDRLLDAPVSYTSAEGTVELRTAIANLEGVDPDEVQVMTGGQEALLVLFFLAAEPGANIVLPRPGFPANTALTEGLGIEIRSYSLRAENDFRIDLDEIRALCDHNTRMVFVNSPHNPTGTVLTGAEMESIHDFCADRGIQFVSDEVYHPIYHGPPMRSAARLPHATVVSDFSKALCLSGLRVGWIIDHDARRREQYKNARNFFTVTNNSIGEQLATLAIQHSASIYARAQRVASANLALLDTFFEEHRDVLRWHRPQGGMTAFPWLAEGGDTREFCRSLAREGVLIAPGDCFGEPSHFRLGFAASGERFPLAIERFAGFLNRALAAAGR